MFGLMKIAGVSAILSAGLVNAFPDAPAAPKHLDRLPQAQIEAAQEGCAAQVWPNISHSCLTSVDGTPVRLSARIVTVEAREGANISVLMRVPAPAAAH